MKPIKRILIANRGEIACRIIRTCRKLDIETVAVYSEVDQHALHVRTADHAVGLGDAEASQSYLNIEKIIRTARQNDCDAVHPGYGFLSENADFAQSCLDAGLLFIGPPPEVIAAMGDKVAAKKLMMANGVPTLPAHFESLGIENAPRLAKEMGYPVLLKAAAGGGGKGMRIVRNSDDLVGALQSAQREALAAFGDQRIFMEKFLETPRHIEVQVMADDQGRTQHLFERDCSVQRRHQKIIEESPSTVLGFEQRNTVCQMALKAVEVMQYRNVGTVEFLFDGDQFYFLEMNTRLQVEHPVTEWVTGTDLVREQIRLAAGYRLTKHREPTHPRGHSLELRIYAEDPAANFLPSAGTIEALVEPQGPGLRVDSSLFAGWSIPVQYDPLIAKMIVWDETRRGALRRALKALQGYRIDGVSTNIAFLGDILCHPDFAHNNIDTNWVERCFAQWEPSERCLDDDDLYTPWIPGGQAATAQRRAAYRLDHAEGGEEETTGPVEIRAPMPGKVIETTVHVGDAVKKGERLIVVEAMKMEHALTAPRDAKVFKVHRQNGDQVKMGEILISLE